MFKIDSSLFTKINMALAIAKQPAQVGPTFSKQCNSCGSSCGLSCQSTCRGGCSGGCTRSCTGRSR